MGKMKKVKDVAFNLAMRMIGLHHGIGYGCDIPPELMDDFNTSIPKKTKK